MEVYKFGGASLRNADAIRQVGRILLSEQKGSLIIVVSAMGKTTNALELVCSSDKAESTASLEKVIQYHHEIMNELFQDSMHAVFEEVNNHFVEIDWALEEEGKDASYVYDQVVSQGEFISSRIVGAYLKSIGLKIEWIDARDLIHTDDHFREAGVDWEMTEKNCRDRIKPDMVYITQGFIGVSPENYTTTLGREGSDYSAAILAYCTDAKKLTIWKDVPGVLNADPKFFKETILYRTLNYHDAIELAYYGASVIHPKTIQPLQQKSIPLEVRSFENYKAEGTSVGSDMQTFPLVPGYIIKRDQVLVSISSKDFAFIVEKNLMDIFSLLNDLRIKVNLMQNSAISFSICIDQNENFEKLTEGLKNNYRVLYNEGLELLTIRHYDQETINRMCEGKENLLEQKSRSTVQMVLRP